MSNKIEWEAILKLEDLPQEYVEDYSEKLNTLDIFKFSQFDDAFKMNILTKMGISDFHHILYIINNAKGIFKIS